MLNPQKQIANIGATPTTGAAIPLYRPRNPYNDKDIVIFSLGVLKQDQLKNSLGILKIPFSINTENKLMEKCMSTNINFLINWGYLLKLATAMLANQMAQYYLSATHAFR